ncbi:MAG: hypothetical protein M1511_18135 [Deltaproteobacteria bacterium]|nr:hypothetical protein [Deltaproteobacteria bacterium]
MSADDIFLTAEEVMDRWGMMDPNDFDTMIGFEFSPNDDITTTRSDHRYRYRPGDLLAYDKYSREPAIWGPSEGGEDRDFSKFVDHNDALDPVCLKYLIFTFHDVEECEKKKPELIRYAEWARTYRQKTGQKAKQVLDELYGKNKKTGVTDATIEVTVKDDSDEMGRSKQAIDESGRYSPLKETLVRARCQAIAELILEQKPYLRAAQLSKSRYIKDLACTLRNDSQKGDGMKVEPLELSELTLRSYVKHLCKPGSKGTLTQDQMNQEIVIDVRLVDKKI